MMWYEEFEMVYLEGQIRSGKQMAEFIDKNDVKDISFARVCTLMNEHNRIMVKKEIADEKY